MTEIVTATYDFEDLIAGRLLGDWCVFASPRRRGVCKRKGPFRGLWSEHRYRLIYPTLNIEVEVREVEEHFFL